MRSRKFKSYGPVPRNEFTIADTNKTDSDAALGQVPESDDAQNDQHVMKPRTPHGLGRLRSSGWLRSRSTNGWRAESASEQHEADNEAHIESIRKE